MSSIAPSIYTKCAIACVILQNEKKTRVTAVWKGVASARVKVKPSRPAVYGTGYVLACRQYRRTRFYETNNNTRRYTVTLSLWIINRPKRGYHFLRPSASSIIDPPERAQQRATNYRRKIIAGNPCAHAFLTLTKFRFPLQQQPLYLLPF